MGTVDRRYHLSLIYTHTGIRDSAVHSRDFGVTMVQWIMQFVPVI